MSGDEVFGRGSAGKGAPRYVAFAQLKLSGRSLMFGGLSLLGAYLLFGYSVLINACAIRLGVILGVLVYRQLYATLLMQGLAVVLDKKE